MSDAYASVIKDRKELDKVRFSTYETEILARHPHLKKNEAGIFFNYEAGVYRMLTRDDMTKIIVDAMQEDNLWTYRTGKNVSDKIMCLSAIVPFLEETNDEGKIVNVKNG